jgi:GNAT superfamily N-acetyltransferase
MIEIRTGDRRAAFNVPFNVYPAESPYVSPMWQDLDRTLDPRRNPLVEQGRGRLELFTAHVDGKALGRIAAVMHDASNSRHGTAVGQFGFFDCGDNAGVADALLSAAESWLHAHGASEIAGNFNLTAMQMAGVLTEGFEASPYTDMMWSPAHIAQHLLRRGYRPFFPMTTFETDLGTAALDALDGEHQKSILADDDFAWHPITRKSFKERLEDARSILNAAFDKNPMFVPLTPAEFQFQAGEMMWIMDPRLPVVVHYRGKPAGVIVCIPDLNPMIRACASRMSWTMPWHFLRHRLTRDRAIVIYSAVIPELHGRGLGGAMLGHLIRAAKAAGYRKLGVTWVADVNKASLRQMEKIGAKPLHRLHLFRKTLGDGS